MAYRFKRSDATVEHGVRRIAGEQFDRAIATALGGGEPTAIVHEVRTRCKQLRGLVRLVRDDLDGYAAANAAVRDAAAGLSALRDRGAMVETCTRLAEGPGDEDGRRAAALLARAFADRVDAGGTAAETREKLTAFADTMAAARATVQGWQVDGRGFEPVAHGLIRTLGEAEAAMRTARKEREIEAFHAWRKSVKYHWYHARLLSPVWPETIAPQIEAAKGLGELLGHHHDLAVLTEHLAADPAPADVAAIDTAAVAALVATRAAALERDAFALGALLFAERPKRLARRWGKYWKLWRSAAPGGAGRSG
ncbi:CHAD domain-containing protein [Methylobrevis albus]|uniref:CHAD domain-containing protein n=1 Tax=Methylobrevis albus TaxID=2793297 RepID=A0A931MXX4_9HYPH|nr:CHAD domain-containing protein [Methylobrevis albus]MBH0237430.1 CHAD domain-containing protein [Methylobrevis albus]